MSAPPNVDARLLDCSNVLNSNCAVEERNRGPVCGQVEDFKFAVVAPERVDWSDAEAPLTVNVSFRPMASIRRDVLYYVALYGEAVRYENADQVSRASSVHCVRLQGYGNDFNKLTVGGRFVTTLSQTQTSH